MHLLVIGDGVVADIESGGDLRMGNSQSMHADRHQFATDAMVDPGIVENIEEDTRQLVRALARGTPIVITTLQKFPFVAETLEKLREEDHAGIEISTRGKNFAVIVDEAHSSQSIPPLTPPESARSGGIRPKGEKANF